MLAKYYVAHEVVLRKKLIRYGLTFDLNGCHFNKYFFVSRKVVLVERDKEGNYLYSNGRKKCTVVDPNDLVVSIAPLECNSCIMRTSDKMDCKSMTDVPDELLGIIDIQPITSFTRTSSLTEAISFASKYNDVVNDEYVYVDDELYIDTIREIDDSVIQILDNGIARSLAKTKDNDEKIQEH